MRHRNLLVIFVLVLLGALPVPATARQPAPDAADLLAPTRLYPEPDLFRLLRLNGDRVEVRYTPGSLDRAANLQLRLETVARGFERWYGHRPHVTVYNLTREEWQQARLPVAYGIPTRVGTDGIAVPAFGDDDTVLLWAGRLGGVLPVIAGMPLRGTPQHAASLVVCDIFVQVQMAEILVDALGVGGDDHWVRGLAAHLASLTSIQRLGTDRVADLDELYRRLAAGLGPRSRSPRDYSAEISFEEWLWFQAQFYSGARAFFDKAGKDSLKKLIKMRKKDGTVSGDLLRRKHKVLDEWFQASFSAVSRVKR